MPDLDYGEDRTSFAFYPYVNTIFDKETHRMIYKDGRGRVAGCFVKTMAERHREWHETTTKDDMVLFFKNQHEANPLDYIVNPVLFERDIKDVDEFAGELSDESKTMLEEMREDILTKHEERRKKSISEKLLEKGDKEWDY
jgi:hypothetical protein